MRESGHERLERDARLEPGERDAQAEASAEAECDLPVRIAAAVKAVRIRDATLVAF